MTDVHLHKAGGLHTKESKNSGKTATKHFFGVKRMQRRNISLRI